MVVSQNRVAQIQLSNVIVRILETPKWYTYFWETLKPIYPCINPI